jgi:hypothetical protein
MKPLIFFSLVAILYVGACKPSGNDPVLQGTIHDSTARRLVQNFGKRVYQIHQGGLTSSDTRCVWFSIEQLKSLISRIEKDTCKGKKGIRFYFATYDPTIHKDAHCKPQYQNCTTLVMVSTRDSIKEKVTLHFDYYNDTVRNMRGGILTTTPENQGELCPPPANCNDDGATLLKP